MNEIRNTLLALNASGNLRAIPDDTSQLSDITDFSSNDYLGLGANTALRDDFLRECAAESVPLTSSASRLLSARQSEYLHLEKILEDAYQRPALLFNSGYHANTGLISALGGKDTLFVADKLVHASIVDGLVLSKSQFVRFRHNDMDHARRLIEKNAAQYKRLVIIAESVYSMDGDTAPIDELIRLKSLHPDSLLYIDEAHAIGVRGPAGLGEALHFGDSVDIIVGTFGKAIASEGAFAALNDDLRRFMVNRCRSLIFSTAISPLMVRWTARMLSTAMGMDTERVHLKKIAHILYSKARTSVDSHIQPFIIGNASRAVQISRQLMADRMKVLPIRTPTVPPGSERLRISLSAAMTVSDVQRLADALNLITI